jgi:hypothetical protein
MPQTNFSQPPAELHLEFIKAIAKSLQTFSPLVQCDFNSMTQAIAAGLHKKKVKKPRCSRDWL